MTNLSHVLQPLRIILLSGIITYCIYSASGFFIILFNSGGVLSNSTLPAHIIALTSLSMWGSMIYYRQTEYSKKLNIFRWSLFTLSALFLFFANY
ncbi:hypothetical protein [Sediminitomix flava]|uniref:Uncharacterized protein n=1 Tax=Sediminitomix flava TaxID=379075 RepID=A0A315ZCM7_SEDFL|nr:hypothetical protein [Sediminitomix flava]PWJ42853.1 hypothetical protein BC781_102399 [Sediminitomix flava]